MKLYCLFLVSLPFIKSCGEKLERVSVLRDVRVSAAQFYVPETTALSFPSTAKIPPQNCKVWADSVKYCQQYPIRPATKSYLKFYVISPPSLTPALSLQNFTQLQLSKNSTSLKNAVQATGISSAVATKVPVTRFAFSLVPNLSKIVQQSPMRIEEVVYEFTTPQAAELLADAQDSGTLSLPIFEIKYTAQSANSKNNDEGFVTFTILPDSEDTQIWNGVTSSEQAQNSPQLVASLRAQSVTNHPPIIESISPAQGVSLGNETTLEFKLSRPDSDENAKSRVQWYATRGEFSNDRGKKTKWKSKESGEVGVFAVIRDLQGGSDVVYSSFLP